MPDFKARRPYLQAYSENFSPIACDPIALIASQIWLSVKANLLIKAIRNDTNIAHIRIFLLNFRVSERVGGEREREGWKSLKVSDNHGYLAIFEWFNIRIQTVISVFGVASNRVAAASPFEVILPSFAATSLRTHCPDFYRRLLTNCLHQDFLNERLCMETSQDRKFSQSSHKGRLPIS